MAFPSSPDPVRQIGSELEGDVFVELEVEDAAGATATATIPIGPPVL